MRQEKRRRSAEQKIICTSCGAPYGADLPKCPYCGALNAAAAEEEYLEKLQDVRQDLEELKDESTRATGRELARSGRMLRRVVVTVVCLIVIAAGLRTWLHQRDVRQQREDYVWRSENFPLLDGYYESGDTEAMLAMFNEASEKGKPVWDWKHAAYCDALNRMKLLDSFFELDRDAPEDADRRPADVLYQELCLAGADYLYEVDPEDLERIRELREPYLADMRERYDMTEEEWQGFEKQLKEHYGYPEFKPLEEYVKQKGESES